jgi:hypothetical protein
MTKLQRIVEVGSIPGISISGYEAFDANTTSLPNSVLYQFLVYGFGSYTRAYTERGNPNTL